MPRYEFQVAQRTLSKLTRAILLVSAVILLVTSLSIQVGYTQEKIRLVEVDCNKERKKQVKLENNEDSVEFIFVNCPCDETSQKVKNMVDGWINSIRVILSRSDVGIGEKKDLVDNFAEKLGNTRSVNLRPKPTGSPEKSTWYCYPASTHKAILNWARAALVE